MHPCYSKNLEGSSRQPCLPWEVAGASPTEERGKGGRGGRGGLPESPLSSPSTIRLLLVCLLCALGPGQGCWDGVRGQVEGQCSGWSTSLGVIQTRAPIQFCPYKLGDLDGHLTALKHAWHLVGVLLKHTLPSREKPVSSSQGLSPALLPPR